MDRLNNNYSDNSSDGYLDNFNSISGDIRIYNDSRNTPRVMSYSNNRIPMPFNSQKYTRENFDRMKDRQISILNQKINILETELLATRQKYPVLHEYSMMDQFSNGNKHLFLQNKLLSTALSEKFEELRQTKEDLRQTKREYELVMQERTAVHGELQEQTAEIDRLKNQNQTLEDQLNFRSSLKPHGTADNENSVCCLRLNDVLNENETLKSDLTILQSRIQDLTSRNEKSCIQLNAVLDKYHKLKTVLSNGTHSNKIIRSISGSKVNEEIVNGCVKMIDLKMMILKIVCDKTCTDESIINENRCNSTATTVHGAEGCIHSTNTTDGSREIFYLRESDQLLDIEGTSVANWSDNEIIEFLTRFEVNSYLSVAISRRSLICGNYISWRLKMDTTFVNTLCLSPLWMVSEPDSYDVDTAVFKIGDILQLNNNNNKSTTSSNRKMSVKIIRFNPLPLSTNETEFENHIKKSQHLSPITYRAANYVKSINVQSKYQTIGSPDFNSCLFTDQSLFPVLPVKQKPNLYADTCYRSSHRPTSDYDLSQHSTVSVASAPPVPPRSSTSLQYSFLENMDQQNAFNLDTESVENREFEMKANEKLNLSVQSAMQFNFRNSINTASRELMSASFNCTSEFSSNKIPKLGKCRKLTLTVPSNICCLKDLGLHLLHGKTEEEPVSKSDVDVSVINQIFIRSIDLNSIAHSAGLVEGDEIITINNNPVSKMTAEEAENAFLTNPLKPDRQKYSLLIKAQFNPLKMHELFKEKDILPFDPNISAVRFTRSMYDDTNFSRGFHDNGVSHRLHVIRSSSNVNVASADDCDSSKLKHDFVCHLKTHHRAVRINFYTVLKLIKIMGGSNVGIFISNIIYKDGESEEKDKESIGNRLAIGDRILEVNGEKFTRMIGEAAVSILNNLSHQTTLKVIYDPSGLLSINSDPFCQEKFYMKATFSFSELDNPLTAFVGKREKASSVSSRLDHLIVNIPFLRNFHLSFEKDDILLVDATILPSSMTQTSKDENSSPSYWHAWVVDRQNNKIRNGMVPSAFWIEQTLLIHSKSFKTQFSDKSMKNSLRSTLSSPISENSEYLSSPSSSFQNDSSKLFHARHSRLGHRFFSRMSFKHHTTNKSVSSDDSNKIINFQKFIPVKRLPKASAKRPVILLGAHSETIAKLLSSERPHEYIMEQCQNTIENLGTCKLHHIISVKSKESITELHQNNIFPIVLLLNYKRPKQIKHLRVCKTLQIKFSRSELTKLFSQIKEYETDWSDLIIDSIFPSQMTDICEAISKKVETIQSEDIWLNIDKFEYSD